MNEICLRGNTVQCKAEFAAAAKVGMKLTTPCFPPFRIILSITDAANIAESVGVSVYRKGSDYYVTEIVKSRVLDALRVALKEAQKRQTEATADVNRLFDIIQKL